jgi:hypothetical protein
VHRDLKPSNVFLVRRPDERIQIKILDFGVAKIADEHGLTRTGVVVGTPSYMAPEQARGSANVDARADVYAVGAVLYRLLTGKPPFPDDDPHVTINRLLTEDPKRPRELERSIPEALELVIQRAMSRSPRDRPKNALELDRELGAFDARADGPTLAVQAHTGSGFVDHLNAVGVVARGRPAMEVINRAKGARSTALGLALTVGVVAGAAVFVIACSVVLLLAGRANLTDSEKILLGVIAGFSVLFATVGSLRALASRWRNAWAVERLTRGLRLALVALLETTGVLAIGWRAYRFVATPPPTVWLPMIDIALVAIPTILGAWVFVRALRKAQTHD